MLQERFMSFFMKIPFVIRLFLFAFLINLMTAVVITIIEPETFRNIFQGLWWAVVTSATVGYGDLVPQSVTGKLLAIVLIFTGVAFMTYYFTYMAHTVFIKQQTRLTGQSNYKGGSHMILIGWNARAKEIAETSPIRPTVLIDDSLDQSPSPNLHFIKGIPYEDAVLSKANISKAKHAFITADHNVNETIADMKTIMTIIAIKGLNPSIKIVAEILSPTQVSNAKRAGVDDLIETSKLTSQAFTQFIT